MPKALSVLRAALLAAFLLPERPFGQGRWGNFPWHLSSEFTVQQGGPAGFLASAPQGFSESFTGAQYTLAEGLTLQPWDRAWLHLGLGSRWNRLPGLDPLYIEPLALKSGAGLALLPPHLYAGFAFRLPFFGPRLGRADSGALLRHFHQPGPLPESVDLPGSVLAAGLFAEGTQGPYAARAGLIGTRPGKVEVFPGSAHHPALRGDFRLELERETAVIRQALALGITLYGSETQAGIPAHREGMRYRLHYSLGRAFSRLRWENGIGGSFGLSDRNRLYRIESPLVETEENGNLQHAFVESFLQPEGPRLRGFSFGLRPLVLWQGGAAAADSGFGGVRLDFEIAKHLVFLRAQDLLLEGGLHYGTWGPRESPWGPRSTDYFGMSLGLKARLRPVPPMDKAGREGL